MKINELPTQEYLQECFTYDPETGLLYWKNRPLKHFKSEWAAIVWNKKYPGKIALNGLDKDGYRRGELCGHNVRAHRIIYKLVTGKEPNIICHENGSTEDNRIDKISSGTISMNNKDKAKHITNTSGITGVRWREEKNRWFAEIGIDGKKKHLGCFRTKEEAIAARKAAEIEYGYHPNHGRSSTELPLQTVTL